MAVGSMTRLRAYPAVAKMRTRDANVWAGQDVTEVASIHISLCNNFDQEHHHIIDSDYKI